jgi:hypothetical protein
MLQDTDFDKFWAAFPKKRSKGEARRAWMQTASIRPPVTRIINALLVMAASADWQKDRGQFIPYPASWLRAEGWEDVAEVDIVNGKFWWQTVTGVNKKAEELGMKWDAATETYQQFALRIKRFVESSNIIQMRAA